MACILLGLTGSVASIKAPELFHHFLAKGHHVRVVATRHACRFFDPADLGGKADKSPRKVRDPEICTVDEDEWPVAEPGKSLWQRGDEVLHIRLRRWADLLVVAPLDATTLAKFALGLCDNCLTCVWRAWDPSKPRLIAPAMNTLMWEQPVTTRHLLQLAQDAGSPLANHASKEEIQRHLATGINGLHLAGPESKRLACGDDGMGAMASIESLVHQVENILSARQI
jgi:phosphopantothenoylcysteine decarboxylase